MKLQKPLFEKKYKVLSVVLNEVLHDTRVIESARAISDLDYQVTILGVKSEESIKIKQDPNKSISLNFTPKPSRRCFIDFLNVKIKNSKIDFLFLQFRIIKELRYEFLFLFLTLSIIVSSVLLIGGKYTAFILTGLLFAYLGLQYFTRKIKTVKSGNINVMEALARLLAHVYYENNILLFMRGFKPDIIHCNDLPVLKIAKLYKDDNPRVMLVYDSHEIFCEMTGLNYFEKIRWSIHEESLASEVDAFITVNPYISDILNKRNPDLPRGIVVRNAFHKIDKLSNSQTRKTSIDNNNLIVKRILALKGNDVEGKRILLFQGGIGYGRGLEKLVKSTEFLKEEWVVVFIGWGSLQSELELLAASAETLDRKVFFLPKVHRDELGLWTRCADIGIIPYEKVSMNNWYCSPNKLWEYPSCSVPILVSPNPYLREVVEENSIGWVLPERFRGEDIAFIINKLGEDEIDDKRGNCDRYSRQNCWESESQNLKGVYASLCKSK